MKLPDKIELNGMERQASLSTAIGRINLRWTREDERLFGRTPERATIEAAAAVAKALRQSSFPSRVKHMNQDLKIIFISKNIKTGQVPSGLITACHPGWMTPPANIYIVSELAAGSCGGSPVAKGNAADSLLARVLIHEIGHVVEYTLAPGLVPERARAEGFASWFEVFAGRFSGLLDSAAILGQQKLLSRQLILTENRTFNGDAASYALAAGYFHVLTENRMASELTRIYDQMSARNILFIPAVSLVTGWSERELSEKVEKFING